MFEGVRVGNRPDPTAHRSIFGLFLRRSIIL
jgi:hypothetical protein